MLKIVPFEFTDQVLDEILISNVSEKWPVVYFIHNDKEAYIGETTNIFLRVAQHRKNPERLSLNKIYVITDKTFNKSAIMDIESQLIKYVSADGKFKLQNLNSGLQNHNYYQKDSYEKMFRELWKKLKKKHLAVFDIQQIENSDLFKYSPYKSLTTDQYFTVDLILDKLAKNFSGRTTTIVNGGAGTGKTVLAVYLIKLLSTYDNESHIFDDEFEEEYVKNIVEILKQKQGLKIALVVPMTSLRKTLKKVFKGIKGLSPNMVIGPNDVAKDYFDILVVDEAHRLRRRKNITNYKEFDKINRSLGLGNEGTELDWILAHSQHQVMFYDSAQTIRPADIRSIQFDGLLTQNRIYSQFELTSQMRSLGGQDYINYVKDIFALKPGLKRMKLTDYDFRIFDDVQEMYDHIREKDSDVGLSRMVAGYGWEWITKDKSLEHIHKNKLYDIEIDKNLYIWNSTNKDWVNSDNAINEIGCIHTTQGYDLNYVGVIIGHELKYDADNNRFLVNLEAYFDRNGYVNIDNELELQEYILNIYTTLFLRGIKGTYVYVCDSHLREYIRRFLSQ